MSVADLAEYSQAQTNTFFRRAVKRNGSHIKSYSYDQKVNSNNQDVYNTTTSFVAGTTSTGASVTGTAAIQQTGHFYEEFNSLLLQMPKSDPTGSWQSGIRHGWKWEQLEVKLGGSGTRHWTPAEREILIREGKVPGYDMHHINNKADHPEIQGDPNNVRPVNRKEHLDAHNGDFRNRTEGELYDRQGRVTKVNNGRILKNELLAAGSVFVGSIALGALSSWIFDPGAGWRTHLTRGVISGGVAITGYGFARGAAYVAEHVFNASGSTIAATMGGAALLFGMITSGVMAYKSGLRGMAVLKEVAWTGVSGVISSSVAFSVKAGVVALASKGAILGSWAGPIGVVVGVGAAITVGFVLESVKRWWIKNNIGQKVKERIVSGANWLKDTVANVINNFRDGVCTVVDKIKSGAQTLYDKAKEIGSSIVEGVKDIGRTIGNSIKQLFRLPSWGW